MYRVTANRNVMSDEGKRVSVPLPSFTIDQAEDDSHAYVIAAMILGDSCSMTIVRLA